MAELGIIPNGAILIRDGIVDQVGPTRRIENLKNARNAREIDATGRIVMPAFVDADAALVTSAAGDNPVGPRLMSRTRLLEQALAGAEERARYGCSAVGAQTGSASDFRTVVKILRAHRVLEKGPLRIVSIFSPRFLPGSAGDPAEALKTRSSNWLAPLVKKNLASVLELTVAGPENVFDPATLINAARAAASCGWAVRLRSPSAPEPVHLQLAIETGAIGMLAPIDTHFPFARRMTDAGVVRLIPASAGFDNDTANAARAIRAALDSGAAIALTTSYRLQGISSVNMQHVLHVAVHRLGFSAEEAITATTWNAACSLRISHVSGSLEQNKPADLLVMDVPDYRELPRRAGHRDACLVMRGGRIVYRNPQPALRR